MSVWLSSYPKQTAYFELNFEFEIVEELIKYKLN